MANAGSGGRFAGWIGEVSGYGPGQTIVMDAAKRLEAVFTESEPLRPGVSKSVTLRASDEFQLYSRSEGYNVLVPPDAAELTVRFQSPSAAEVDLYVHRGGRVRLESAAVGETPRVHADFGSTSPGATETVTINRESVPPLANEVYFIGLAVPPTRARIEGTLSVEVLRSGIAKAWPRALTFVSATGSDPGPQTVGLIHETGGADRYRIVSTARWLTANPQEWVRSSGGAEEITVMANTAGVAHGTHGGSLTVLKASTGQGETSWSETGVEIPVALAVVPSDGGMSTSRRANAVTIDSRPQGGDTYGAGEEIRVSVSFADPVAVSGTPALNLRVGDRTRQATWSGDGSRSVCEAGYKSLEFRYVVQAEDRDADGIGIAATALTLNGGSIKTTDGLDSTLVLGGPATRSAATHKIDGSMAVVPEVSGLGISSRPSNGTAYAAGESIAVWVRFTSRIEATGSPRLALTVGSRTRHASFSSANRDGVSLHFRYEVQAEDADADGIGIAANALTLNGGSIRNPAGTDADLDLGSHAIVNAADHRVDGSVAVVPQVSGLGISGGPSNGTAYAAGESIAVWVRFTSRIEATGSPRLALTVGSRTRHASFSSASRSGAALFFRYEVQAEDADADGIGIAANALTLNGGSIRNPAGTDADLDLGSHAILNAADHRVDGSMAVVPQVSGLGISGRPSNGTAYAAGESITVWVRFTTPIKATGSPRLALTVGSRTRHASFSSASRDGDALFFRYEVQAEDADADGIGIAANALTLNGGSIRSPAGTDADLDLGSHAIVNAADHKVDGGG